MKAKAITEPVHPPAPKLIGITLQLTTKEAYFLEALMCKVGGCPDTSDRRIADGIRYAIWEFLPRINSPYLTPEGVSSKALMDGKIFCGGEA